MLKSMTGFGRAELVHGDKITIVEIKSLNGKQLEMNLKIPPLLKPFEFEIRSLLQENLQRGSVDLSVNLRQNGSSKPVTINSGLAKQYYEMIQGLSTELDLPLSDVLNTILRLPEVIIPGTEQMPEEEWLEIREVILSAIHNLDVHRQDEGAMLEKDLLLRIQNILSFQEKIQILEPERKLKMKQRLENLLHEQVGKENTDSNRLEQELIYYIEKVDFTEEQVRLTNHCRYFRDILDDPEPSKGKKLSFILQEFGREINTLGSKANDSQIQQWVVMMKDELEKAKEQTLNVL
ncbi:MAG: YicC/YloC family endoribonuclease [Chitinophagaceae bacterium]